jgi:DNA-binding transcriptional LysR family regulator
VPTVLERGVPQEERQTEKSPRLPDWDVARIFLEVVRCGSFRSAAERLGQSINSVRRRIDEFENLVGTALFVRDVYGTRLTDEGLRMVAGVERMEHAAFDLLRDRHQVAPAMSGEVRVAVTEGLGTFWVAPRLVEFQRAYPSILVDLHCDMESADILRNEADISIQLSKPTAQEVKIVRLGRFHMMMFASQRYIDAYGRPKCYDDLSKHRFVMHLAHQTGATEIFESWFPGVALQDMVVMKTNTATSNYWAVVKGAGIGVFPTYAYAIGAQLIPLQIDLHFERDIWLSYHPGSQRIARCRRMIDWIVDAFNPSKFPWFRDEFIHPTELEKLYKGGPLINMFEGFNIR